MEFKRFETIFIGAVVLIVWIVLIIFFVRYGESVQKDPCSICAKRMGDNVVCRTENTILVSRIYYPNGTIEDIVPKFDEKIEVNTTILEGAIHK